ncbi:NADH dehydrogenase [ubiquinone] iron-sulfur protein 5 [Contarinia nasturtii]|uniref:NADH dehydrogenase [ubiquinone] iron-sulfur protein 5 n=1 Tax=Contarinia nasturtii TaxID=265458 RepID=UPI0012D493B7|nr:NADH dehydrogenase [ubiquinone] iron-sulfur protein 5 [Contarinia nasturtii]XP_031632347.1 NADH dehydrogenase [ubiquinone] iron-sulfur protein 5 [Contarinia nasturtii]
MQSDKHLENISPKPEVYFPNVLSPYFRSPFTDVFGSIINHQQYGKCARFEMNMMECLEAYGVDKGRVKCADLIDDFNECHNMTKQFLRHMAMNAERQRRKEKYAPAPHPNAY